MISLLLKLAYASRFAQTSRSNAPRAASRSSKTRLVAQLVFELLLEPAMGGVVGGIETVPRDLVPERFCGNLLYATLRYRPDFDFCSAGHHSPS